MRDYDELVVDLQKMRSTEYCVITSATDFPAYKILRESICAIEELVAMRNVLKSRLAQLEKAEYESGDCAETYKNGFLIGKRQGTIELLREILGIDVDEPPKEVE